MRVAIVGAGISGLATAYYLRRLAPRAVSEVAVYEMSPRHGGWIDSSHRHVPTAAARGPFVVESGPRTLRPATLAGALTLQLISNLGLRDKIRGLPKTAPAAVNRLILHNDRLTRAPTVFKDYLMPASANPAFGNLALSAAYNCLQFMKTRPSDLRVDGETHDESVHALLSRQFGQRVADGAATAIGHGVFAADIRKLSARVAMPDLVAAESASGSSIIGLALSARARRAKLAADAASALVDPDALAFWQDMSAKFAIYSLDGGLATLTDTLAAWVSGPGGVKIHYGCQLDQVTSGPAGAHKTLRFRGPEGDLKTATADHVVFAASLPRFSQVIPQLQHTRNWSELTVAVVQLVYDANDARAAPELPAFGILATQLKGPQTDRELLGIIFDSHAAPVESESSVVKYTVMFGGHYWNPAAAHQPSSSLSSSLSSTTTNNKTKYNEHAPFMRIREHELLSRARHAIETFAMRASSSSSSSPPPPVPLWQRVRVLRNCMPGYEVGHGERMQRLGDALWRSGYSVAGNWAPGASAGVQECVSSARRVALKIKANI